MPTQTIQTDVQIAVGVMYLMAVLSTGQAKIWAVGLVGLIIAALVVGGAWAFRAGVRLMR